MRKVIFTLAAAAMLVACNKQQSTMQLTQEWDKVFPLSEQVSHKKVTFTNQYGLTLAADLYDGGFTEPAGHGESKNLIPWDTLAEFFGKYLK